MPFADADMLRPVALLAAKRRGQHADINRWDIELGYALIPIRDKRVGRYVRYARDEFNKGVRAIHLVACGQVWIAKAHRVAAALVLDGVANVFLNSPTPADEREPPGVVLTLVSSRVLAATSPDIWVPDEVERWTRAAADYRAWRRQVAST